ncbi:pentapeptide repeat-containing protein [Flavobacterium sp.]|uniref:pentapeptide repeat-containing protein n=1 Tax=Flavobacterium sp. TaxID=239 RepID=UPI0039E657BF
MRKSDYFFETVYNDILYEKDDANFKEFEGCTFNRCDFSRCTFLAVTFIDCVFNDCIFNGAKINYVALRTVTFNRCQIKEVNFAMCDKLIFEIAFNNCTLDFSKFYTLKIKGTVFTDCSVIAVDFMGADLTSVVFDRCDLYRSEFSKAILNKADLRTARNYTINPQRSKIKKARFSLEGLKGLLAHHDIVVQ